MITRSKSNKLPSPLPPTIKDESICHHQFCLSDEVTNDFIKECVPYETFLMSRNVHLFLNKKVQSFQDHYKDLKLTLTSLSGGKSSPKFITTTLLCWDCIFYRVDWRNLNI